MKNPSIRRCRLVPSPSYSVDKISRSVPNVRWLASWKSDVSPWGYCSVCIRFLFFLVRRKHSLYGECCGSATTLDIVKYLKHSGTFFVCVAQCVHEKLIYIKVIWARTPQKDCTFNGQLSQGFDSLLLWVVWHVCMKILVLQLFCPKSSSGVDKRVQSGRSMTRIAYAYM